MAGIEHLEKLCLTIRKEILTSVYHAKSGHLGGSLSAVEILVALYFHKMRVDPVQPKLDERDRFVLSKGHAAPALYAVLANKGFFEKSELNGLRNINSMLQGAPGMYTPGIDMSAGSLGQGISAAVGMALAGKMQKKTYKTYVLLGDGEMQEGQVWEALMVASHHRLGNLIVILDNNHVQMCGVTSEILSIGDPRAKFDAFGCRTTTIDGHDLGQIVKTLDSMDDEPDGPPVVIIAETIKGKGVSFMENSAAWHGGAPSAEQLEKALTELGGDAQ